MKIAVLFQSPPVTIAFTCSTVQRMAGSGLQCAFVADAAGARRKSLVASISNAAPAYYLRAEKAVCVFTRHFRDVHQTTGQAGIAGEGGPAPTAWEGDGLLRERIPRIGRQALRL